MATRTVSFYTLVCDGCGEQFGLEGADVIGLRHFYGDLPMRGIWFAPYGTPLPRTADERLGPEWSTTPPMSQPEPVWGSLGPVRSGGSPMETSVVFDAGDGDERARLLLPKVQVMYNDCDGAWPGNIAVWMVSPARLDRLMREKEQTLDGTGGKLGGARMTACSVNEAVADPVAALAEAACAARDTGMGVGAIIDKVGEALTRHGNEKRRAQARTRIRAYLHGHVGDLLRPELIDELAVGLAEQAQQLGDEGVLLVRER